MPRHILIAHDLSPEADIALRRAAQLAQQLDAQLTLVHISEQDAPSAELLKATELALSERLSGHSHCSAQVRLRSGKASVEILKAVEEYQADLLVLGNHHKGRSELFQGTNLERVARECPVPLLLARLVDSEPYSRAVLALDNSVGACQALRSSLKLLPKEATLWAVNILELPTKTSVRHAENTQDIQRALLRQLVDDESRGLSQHCTVEVDVRPGTLAGTLDEAIDQVRPQLLALGRYNRTRLSAAILGSLPVHYLRHPPCDLLLVK